MKSRFILLLLIMTGLVVAFAPLPVQPNAPQERTFRVEAGQFAYSPSELKVNPGDSVAIQLVSTDVVHGLYVDGYDISIEADPGQTKTLSFVADKPGSFRFRCNVTLRRHAPVHDREIDCRLQQLVYPFNWIGGAGHHWCDFFRKTKNIIPSCPRLNLPAIPL